MENYHTNNTLYFLIIRVGDLRVVVLTILIVKCSPFAHHNFVILFKILTSTGMGSFAEDCEHVKKWKGKGKGEKKKKETLVTDILHVWEI